MSDESSIPSTNEAAEADLRTHLQVLKSLGVKKKSELNAAVARNVLHEELGYFGPPEISYSLDDVTRDRLIVHARQDAAHASANTTSILDIVEDNTVAIRRLTYVVYGCLALLIWLLIR